MPGLKCGSPTPEYLQVLDDHICAPVEAARQGAQEERTELMSEIDAFTQFAQYIENVKPVRKSHSPLPVDSNPESSPFDLAQDAYRETVLSLPHFEARYGESFIENIRMEFGRDVATVFASEHATFSPILKQRLLREIQASVADRKAVVENVDDELNSLEQAHTRLRKAIDDLKPSQIPLCSDASLTAQLDSIIEMRQQHLSQRPVTDAVDGHDLCDYLYEMEPWTYPVLVAVCRFREAAIR